MEEFYLMVKVSTDRDELWGPDIVDFLEHVLDVGSEGSEECKGVEFKVMNGFLQQN